MGINEGQIWKHNYYLDLFTPPVQHLKSQKPSVILRIKSSSCQNNWKTKAITQGYDNSVQETFSTSTYSSSRCSCTSPRCITASVRGFTTYAQVKWAVWEPSRHIWQTTCYLPVQSSVCSLSSPLGMQQKLLRGPSMVLYRMMNFSHRVLGKGVTNKSTLLLEWFCKRQHWKHEKYWERRGPEAYFHTSLLPLSISLSEVKHRNSVHQQIYIVQQIYATDTHINTHTKEADVISWVGEAPAPASYCQHHNPNSAPILLSILQSWSIHVHTQNFHMITSYLQETHLNWIYE